MKRIAFLSIAIFGFSPSLQAAPSKSAPQTFKLDGIRAEFLFNAMEKFDKVPGLEGISDCAMGTCGTSMKLVSCTKSMDEGPSQIFGGQMDRPFMTCSIQSTDARGGWKNVAYQDNDGVRQLRHALVEMTGSELTVDKSKSVSVESIECTAHAINRDMDSLEIESTYECTIIR